MIRKIFDTIHLVFMTPIILLWIAVPILTYTFVIVGLIDLFGLILPSSRAWHFHDAPYERFFTLLGVFLASLTRWVIATDQGSDPYLEASYGWRLGKGLIGPSDYEYNANFYSMLHNTWYLLVLGLFALWIAWEENAWELYPILDWLGWVA